MKRSRKRGKREPLTVTVTCDNFHFFSSPPFILIYFYMLHLKKNSTCNRRHGPCIDILQYAKSQFATGILYPLFILLDNDRIRTESNVVGPRTWYTLRVVDGPVKVRFRICVTKLHSFLRFYRFGGILARTGCALRSCNCPVKFRLGVCVTDLCHSPGRRRIRNGVSVWTGGLFSTINHPVYVRLWV